MNKTFLELCEEFKDLSDEELQIIMHNNRSQNVWEAAYIVHLEHEDEKRRNELKNKQAD